MYRRIYIMCLNPRIIKNNRTDFTAGLHHNELVVPCGECVECQRQRRSDIGFRAVWESTKYFGTTKKPLGGTAIMVLLTYKPECVPHLIYNGHSEMCFNHAHISDLLYMLRAKYNYTLKNQTFSYLIGAEYAVNPQYTERPHYHCLFWLSEDINPHDFMRTIRQIWDYATFVECYHPTTRITYQWSHGSLGLVLPFENDSEHSYIVDSPKRASLYCAKYATKQVGFYNNETICNILKDNKKRAYRYCFPKVWYNRGFGMNALTSDTLDKVALSVSDPFTGENAMLPNALKEKLQIYRTPSYRRPTFDPDTHIQKKTKSGKPVTHIVYKRNLKSEFYEIKHKRLDLFIQKLTDKFRVLGAPHPAELAVYHYVYNRLPLMGVLTFCAEQCPDFDTLSHFMLTNKPFIHDVYHLTKLVPANDIHLLTRRFNRSKRIKRVETMRMIMPDIDAEYMQYYPKVVDDNHHKQSELEKKFTDAQKLRELISPHPF